MPGSRHTWSSRSITEFSRSCSLGCPETVGGRRPPPGRRYGLDFEHHTPLDPFNWQYLVFKKKDGTLNRRPVSPFDPGTQNDLEASDGLRVWHGRHNDPVPVTPAVEYQVRDAGNRKLNTAVCAAFYDTGASFPADTLKAGEKVRVHYRYTGYPAAEAARLFKEAKPYDSPTLDPDHHFIFAEWPKVTFSKFAALSESWIYLRPVAVHDRAQPAADLRVGERCRASVRDAVSEVCTPPGI